MGVRASPSPLPFPLQVPMSTIREIRALKSIRPHENVVRLIEVLTSPGVGRTPASTAPCTAASAWPPPPSPHLTSPPTAMPLCGYVRPSAEGFPGSGRPGDTHLVFELCEYDLARLRAHPHVKLTQVRQRSRARAHSLEPAHTHTHVQGAHRGDHVCVPSPWSLHLRTTSGVT
jgi:hypothetical protein